MMGSASLDIAYVACGRLDAYIEQSVSLWDIAAGKLLVESAGGYVKLTERPDATDKLDREDSGRLGIKPLSGLIEEHDTGLADQRARDRHRLTLSARKRAHVHAHVLDRRDGE